jgi:hypothetical protein
MIRKRPLFFSTIMAMVMIAAYMAKGTPAWSEMARQSGATAH